MGTRQMDYGKHDGKFEADSTHHIRHCTVSQGSTLAPPF